MSMSRSSREPPKRLQTTVFLFPILMGLIGWFVMSRMASSPKNTHSSAATPATPLAVSSTHVLLGRSRPASDRDEKFIYHVEAQTLTPTSSERGWRVSNVSLPSLSQRTEGGVWTVGTSEWTVALRDARGRVYQDPAILGMLDETHVGLVAVSSDRRVVLSVARTGMIRELGSLSETTTPLLAQAGKVWLVDLPLQEGIEVSPMGPSSVWSVAMDGATSTRVTDLRTATIITSVSTNGSEVVLVSDIPDMRWVQGDTLSVPVPGRPLGWLSGQRLVFVQDGMLCLASSAQVAECGPKALDGLTLIGIIP